MKHEGLRRALIISSLVFAVGSLACSVAYWVRGREQDWLVLAFTWLALFLVTQWAQRRVEDRMGIPTFDERIEALRKARERDEAGVA